MDEIEKTAIQVLEAEIRRLEAMLATCDTKRCEHCDKVVFYDDTVRNEEHGGRFCSHECLKAFDRECAANEAHYKLLRYASL